MKGSILNIAATAVQGRKAIVNTAMVFIADESRLDAIATCRESAAMLRFSRESCWFIML